MTLGKLFIFDYFEFTFFYYFLRKIFKVILKFILHFQTGINRKTINVVSYFS